MLPLGSCPRNERSSLNQWDEARLTFDEEAQEYNKSLLFARDHPGDAAAIASLDLSRMQSTLEQAAARWIIETSSLQQLGERSAARSQVALSGSFNSAAAHPPDARLRICSRWAGLPRQPVRCATSIKVGRLFDHKNAVK
jgi:hypothetical protein